ncbi:MAG TPA: DJ-1/PfpI/YhbO family deglycase/protease [Atribacter sp.]|jgi:protease I|nr:DJ-1/PfpI/YhbO family deglycase/protease [Atribacter sp.]MDD3713366.1 DJ-1/PfpI/YhbO family deglycase/protease [Atribacterota bacterium]HOT05141.1 DJ-1/PfpI/YhbO family deglycase/protease [Atribacter sp.]HQK82838.1 DJ-1/PfpI/YhbO family deglycase/protease [Atribacter sp.]
MIFIENLYQELELWYPLLRLKEEGVETKLVGTGSSDLYSGRNGFPAKPEVTASSITSRDFDGIIIPGGFAPDYLRRYPAIINLVKETFQQGKLIGALCHGPSVLISADIIRGKRITGNRAIRDDIVNAGGEYVDFHTVVDGNILTAQGPNDLPVFMKEVIGFFSQTKPRLKSPFPEGFLYDAQLEIINLSSVVKGTAAVLLFFDSIASPIAQKALVDYNRLSESIHQLGGIFLAVSIDSIYVQKEFSNRLELAYPLYSDVSGDTIRAFGVKGKNDLAEWAVFMIDKNGILRYSENCPGGDIESLPGFKRHLETLFNY